jgi:hypothetical protein
VGRDGLAAALSWLDAESGRGPILLHVAVNESESAELERPKLSPAEIATAFRAGVTGRVE